MVARYFTPDEANAELVQLEDALALLAAGVTRALALASALDRIDDGHLGAELDSTRKSIEQWIGAIEARGVRVTGLVPMSLQFPALRWGSEVVLAWQDGDAGVSHWRAPSDDAPMFALSREVPGAFEWCN